MLPTHSKIGTVEVQTPSLPPNSLGGTVYVGEPLKNGPGASSSGEQFRIFIHATSVRYGVNVRLIGKIVPESRRPVSLTAVVEENPQATVQQLQAPPQRWPEGHADQPADLRPEQNGQPT